MHYNNAESSESSLDEQLSAARSLGLWRQLLTLGHTPGVQEFPKVALTRVPSRFPKDEPLLISSKARVVETKDYTFIAKLPLVWYAWDHLAGSENQPSLMLSCCSQS